jgi:triacylglycerol lipase
MTALAFFGAALASALLLVFLDASGKINLLHPLPLSAYLLAASNVPLLGYWFYRLNPASLPQAARIAFLVLGGFFVFYLWVKLNVFPWRQKGKQRSALPLRVRIMAGGRFLCYAGLWAAVLEIPALALLFGLFRGVLPRPVFAVNAVYGVLIVLFILWNGILRLFFTSKRLGVFWRLLMFFTWWLPPVNLIVLLCACRLVYEEYDFALYRENLNAIRADSEICKTKYPLVMVHGVLFRDLKYFNYWGRIPRELIRNGAELYYGNQEAVGTIAGNAEDIKRKILEVLEKTGAEKVNIIAHSKGGLDARYAISRLGMAGKVASLTTISTPHRGCRFVDRACGLPEGFYRSIAGIVDSIFRRLGDKNPDFYSATRQFATGASEEFNRHVPDSSQVYYQSYMTKMKGPKSDPMLALTWLLVKRLEGDNDGLVSLGSAEWGSFRGVLVSETNRGISHGDIIDLKRADYKGFDVLETYVRIVRELKERDF